MNDQDKKHLKQMFDVDEEQWPIFNAGRLAFIFIIIAILAVGYFIELSS